MNETIQITLLSLQISGLATAISLLIGLPLGTLLALGKFTGRSILLSLVNTGMGLPPVVVGLFVAMMLWRSGPFGDLKLIYSPSAIIIAQVIIAFPVVTGLTTASLQALDPRLQLQLRGLGASTPQMVWMLWREARLPLLAALILPVRCCWLNDRIACEQRNHWNYQNCMRRADDKDDAKACSRSQTSCWANANTYRCDEGYRSCYVSCGGRVDAIEEK